MIYLFSDYSLQGPYVGLLKSVLAQQAPGVDMIDICHDLPAFNSKASGYLLSAICRGLSAGSTVLAVVDPGVGSVRRPLWVEADGLHYIGPDNGLFSQVVRRAACAEVRQLIVDQEPASSTFHGRDVFAPAAAAIAQQRVPHSHSIDANTLTGFDWPLQLREVIYIDGYGNAMTGLGSQQLSDSDRVTVSGQQLSYARTFSDAPVNGLFWQRNSIGLIELGKREGSIAAELGLMSGTAISVESG